ncbi:MAG: hypothetical protein IJY99_03890 [Alphaproteobacteria bacterium]|nr:hypothetical protein [Alphaproteobacteria bacterium]
MSFLKNTVSLVALFSVIPAAQAVTARASAIPTSNVVVTAAGRRMPTMTAYLGAAGSGSGSISGSTSSGSTSSSTLLENTECIDAYTGCIKGAEACGPNFEECTTKVLFHGKMPQCLSTLAQCSSGGVSSLFGTSDVSALSTVATTNTYGEVTDYAYPTDGSVLGQMITAAAIENKYDTSTCVRRFTSCLKKESVCGEDFELCTTNTEFRKQRVFCDSTLARCQSDGLIELLGSANMTAMPTATSRVGEMISEGAALAAINAVSTCYKVADQCILNACSANPFKCHENASQAVSDLAESISTGVAPATAADMTAVLTKSAISGYIKNSCMDTIGSNKYCYATFIGDGQMPTSSQLRDEDNKEEIYSLAYSSRMNSGMKAKISEMINKFDTKAKEKCVNTIKTCAMRVCGSGSGASCYAQVFGATNKTINNAYTHNEIKVGCEAVVNSDANCQYAAQNPNSTGTYNYTFSDANTFSTLFPVYDDGAEGDPIGVIASLNASLATSYSDAAIAQMKKQCQSVATSCVRSLCGTDFVNCYRNRTDIYSSLTNTGSTSFDKSMNKVGGVLDYTIVLGLCVDTVKNASVCEEHLAIEANKIKMSDKSGSSSNWGTGSVRSDWVDAGSASKMDEVLEQVQAVDENGNELCSNKAGDQGPCYTVDASGAVYDTPVKIGYVTYVESQAASSLFKDLIYDLEIEAQAKYNAKLTKQQNMCLSSNSGGIIGAKDTGSTYMWVKLKSTKVPANYSVSGLKTSQFAASNELYGSFCRIRVTLHSEDKDIQEAIQKGADWSTAYFAAGDPFTCGSWIPQAKLEEIAAAAGERAREEKDQEQGDWKGWITALGTIGGGVGGAYLGKGISDGSIMGGLTGNTKTNTAKDDFEKLQKNCKSYARVVKSNLTRTGWATAKAYAEKLQGILSDMGITAYSTPQELSGVGASITTPNCKASNAKADAANDQYCCVAGNYETVTEYGGYCYNDQDVTKFKTPVETWIKQVELACEEATEEDFMENKGDDYKKAQKKTRTSSGIGAAVGAIAGGILTYKITDSIEDAAKDKAERQAIEEFMENIGSKIHCFIGSDEVATYGETVSTSME